MTTVSQMRNQEGQMNRTKLFERLPEYRRRVAVTWEAVVEFLVPLGYEDDKGFHYGKPPAPEK